MKSCLLALHPLILLLSSVFSELKGAASFAFNSGSGAAVVLFEKEDESPFPEGYLYAGTYASPPSGTATIEELVSGFVSFGQLSNNPSDENGFFAQGTFSGDLSDLPSSKIYLLASDTLDISNATQVAIVSSSSTSWTFPSSEIDPSVNISLSSVDQYFAGTPNVLEAQGSDFNSIQLTVVEEPEPLVLPPICFVVSGGRPGVEFEFPTAQAGEVEFVLQESIGDTLLEMDWSDVQASPSVESDDGTTQVIRIIHPDLLTSDTERFFRLTG